MAVTNTLNKANINVNIAVQSHIKRNIKSLTSWSYRYAAANPVESVFLCRTVHLAWFVETLTTYSILYHVKLTTIMYIRTLIQAIK